MSTRDIELDGRTLREHAARGTIINGAFLVALGGLTLARGFVVAGFLTTKDYGLWGILIVALGTLVWLKQVGIGDKYIQQDDADQELAFQRAFTLEVMFTAIFMVLLVALVPVVALVYGRSEVVVPGLVLVAILPAGALQAPLWIHYRRMRFVRQRTLQAIDPVVGTVVAIALAVAGAGVYALLIGAMAGAYCAAFAAVVSSPYPLRLRYERGTLRSYASFSWPLLVASGAGIIVAQASVLSSSRHLGLAAVGVISLSATISQFTDRVDGVITGTLYPAICAVADRRDLLFESFVKSNRLALIWAVPFGVGLALFAPDVVHFGIGEKWADAIPVLQAFGISAAIAHLGYNWDAYFRARGDTRPIAWVAGVNTVAFLLIPIPLLFIDGLRGFAIGIGVVAVCGLIARAVFLTRLFEGFGMVRHAARSVAPTLPAVAVVLLARVAEPRSRSIGVALAELSAYVLVTAIATAGFERDLLREVAGYLRRGRSDGATAPAVAR